MRTDFNFKIIQILWLVIVYLFSIPSFVRSQNIPSNSTPTLPPQTKPVEPETLPSLEEILPELEEKPSQDSPNVIEGVPQTIFIKKFEIVGSTVFTPEEFAVVLKTYSMRSISFTELVAAQQVIDQLYFEKGYITSGTFIPPQKLQDGIVVIEVLEGTVEEIKIKGLKRLNSGYVRSRLEVATQTPLNRYRLLNTLQMLQLDPLIKNLNAELTVGTKPGSSILEIDLQEADPFDVTLNFDNYRSPSVGTDRRQVQLTHRNLFGLGDRINVAYLNTDGSDSLNNLNYTIPINAYNGTLRFRLTYTDSKIVEPPFDRFDIESENTNYELTYRQPLIQKPTEDLALGISFYKSDSALTVEGEPRQLSLGAEDNGETDIRAIRFFQEYTTRNAKQVFAVRSEFSLGIDVFGATINSGDVPDSTFFAWKGQTQYIRLLSQDISLLLRSNFQLASDALVPAEQYSLGGAISVRGYRQDALLGDNGLFSSAEIRATILRISQWETSLQLTPFVDFGTVWNTKDDTLIDENTLASVGVGLRLQVRDDFAARLDWGIPLVDLQDSEETLQEDGIYFSLEFKPF